VIHRLKREGGAVPDPPTKLSDLGVFSDLQNLTPAPGLIPYTVNNPLWSDRAAKKRWIALPTDGTFDSSTEQIVFDEEENWNFPSGTVLIKHFDLPTDEGDPTQSTKLETRFFVFTSVGDAYGVTYRWNDAGTEAFLINDAETRDITITQAGGGTYTQTWEFPSRQQCMQCHNSVAGFALGLKTRQLNGDHFYPSSGLTANQLETWNHLNIFHQGIGDPSLLPQLASMEDPTASSEMKVRSYLDANCSYCHRPNGVEGAFDARSLNALFDQNMVGTLGVSHATPTGNIIVTPGQTSTSELWVRDQSTGTNKMPPVGRSLPDADYLAELTTWINNLDGNGPESLADGIYSFTARHSGLLATVENASAADNARMVQSAATGGDEQKWSIQHMGNGKYRILSVATNKALSMKDLRANRGAEVVQLPWSGAQHQLWYFEDTDNGYYQIKNAYNNLHIDVFTGQNTDGLHTVSWTPHSLNNQQWLPSLLSPGGGNPSCPNGELTYLSDLNWTSASQQWGTMRKDLNIFGAQLSINGNTYTKGIGTHALSTIVYDLAGTYETFKSDIGVDQSAGDGAPSSIQFIVNGDGAELYRSPVMTSLDDAISIEINVVGIQTLELIVDGVAAQSPSNNPIHSDHADWADARLENCGDVFDAIGESGSVTFDHNWSTVILSRSYTDPVVIVSDLSFNGGNQSTVRVRNVTANSFEVRVDEWECLDEWHVTETAAYLVVEAGEYELENGKKLIAANEANVNNSWKTLSFPSDFASEPLIFGQCVTENEAEAVNVFVDERNTNLTQMRIKLKEQDKATGGHAHEVVSWIAVETGLHTTDNLMEYVNSGRIVDEGWENLSFQQTYAATPLFIGKIGTEHGGDAAAMRYRNLTATGVQVKVEEETCGDSETGHTNEEIHFIVMAQAGDLMGKDATTPATALLAVTEARFDWLSVQAEQEASRIRLNWRVAGEKDIITYALEQSTDNQTFVITTDQPGSGSPHKVSYEAYDENPYLGMNYYRVKAIDQTGNVYYSQTLHVLYEHNQPIILVYPNPVRKEEMLTADIRISQEGPIKASLIDMQGRSLFTKERTLVGLQAFWQFPIRDIAPGMYLIRFEGEGWSQVQRILIQN
ncbi:MAG: NPCBM/NEW2 domain-containing protein, partial [Bacteroidota bacterium]